jgi:putative redox protein
MAGAVIKYVVILARHKLDGMKIITKMLEEELYEASNSFGNTVSIDMRKHPSKIGLSPVELLLSSVSACGAIDIVMMLRKRRKSVRALTIETEAIRRDSNPRAVTHLHCKYYLVSPDAIQSEVIKIARLALEKYCSVAASLKSEISYSVELTRH